MTDKSTTVSKDLQAMNHKSWEYEATEEKKKGKTTEIKTDI